MPKILKTVLATAALGWALSANATPVTFDLAGGTGPGATSSVNVDFDGGGLLCALTNCGISAILNPYLDDVSATLEVGQSLTFDFFDLKFYGLGGGSGTITASLGFDSPTGAPNANGTGSGGFLTVLGVLTGGNLTWNQAVQLFDLGDGTRYSVEFENLWGVTLGSATVNGRITLLESSHSVPEPATLGLMGLGLLGAGLARRRKAAK